MGLLVLIRDLGVIRLQQGHHLNKPTVFREISAWTFIFIKMLLHIQIDMAISPKTSATVEMESFTGGGLCAINCCQPPGTDRSANESY